MHRPLLLILDGESIKSPNLIQSLERDGWEAAWASPELAIQQSHRGVHPDVVVVDGNSLQDNTVMAVEVLRARNPELPVVAIRTTPGMQDPLNRMLVVLDPRGYLAREMPVDRWPTELRAYLPSMAALGRPLTSDDIFGDLLADLNEAQAPAESRPPAAEPARTPASDAAAAVLPTSVPEAAPPARPAAPPHSAPPAAPLPTALPPVATQLAILPPVSSPSTHLPPAASPFAALPPVATKPATPPGSMTRGLPVPAVLPAHAPLRPAGRPLASPALPPINRPASHPAQAKPAARVPLPAVSAWPASHPAVVVRGSAAPHAPVAEAATQAADAVASREEPRPAPPQTPFEWLMADPSPVPAAEAIAAPAAVLEPSIRDSGSLSLELDVPPMEPPATERSQPASRDLTVGDLPAAPAPVARDGAEVAELFGGILEPLAKPAPDAAAAAPAQEQKPVKPKDDFTLSGIFGINDPFETPKPPEPVPDPVTPPAPDPVPAVTRVSVPPPPAPDVSIDPNQGQVLEEFGNYYLLEKIAVGGMAELFKAKQRGVQGFQKIVAIKRILPHLSDNDEFVRMFIDEAKLAAQLTHPNIAQIYDLGKAGGFYYIAMEYVDGRDLRSLLRKVREYRIPFPESVAAYVAMKVAGALDYAHRKRGLNDKELKLVHRDISPQNIILSSEGAVKLVDFGIAKAATKTTQTLAGALKGKLLYMSPEQAMGQPLDSRSDIYSLGLVLFELLTSERCFQADSELGVLEKVRLGRVQNVQTVNPSVSKQMAQILHKGLQKNLEARYPSARFMERDLKEMMVKLGSEPTEHDVAEYVNTLLRGTKEQLELLINTRFSASARTTLTLPLPTQPVLPPRLEDQTTPVKSSKKPATVAPAPVPLPRPESEIVNKHKRPNWIFPVLAILAVIVGLLIWITMRQ